MRHGSNIRLTRIRKSPVTDLEANINVRCTAEKRRIVDDAAQLVGMTRTQWVLEAIDAHLDDTFGRPSAAVSQARPRMMIVGRTPPELCTHPGVLRSSVGPDGTARCMACNSSITA
jgi:hypothetical protein